MFDYFRGAFQRTYLTDSSHWFGCLAVSKVDPEFEVFVGIEPLRISRELSHCLIPSIGLKLQSTVYSVGTQTINKPAIYCLRMLAKQRLRG
jgi:hypothetical protein